MAMKTYRAAVNLPGIRAGETCQADADAVPYLAGWIKGEYLVPVQKDAPRRKGARQNG